MLFAVFIPACAMVWRLVYPFVKEDIEMAEHGFMDCSSTHSHAVVKVVRVEGDLVDLFEGPHGPEAIGSRYFGNERVDIAGDLDAFEDPADLFLSFAVHGLSFLGWRNRMESQRPARDAHLSFSTLLLIRLV